MNMSEAKNVMDSVATIKQKVELMKQEIVYLWQQLCQSEILGEIAVQEVKEQWMEEVNSLKKQLHQNRMSDTQKSLETQV